MTQANIDSILKSTDFIKAHLHDDAVKLLLKHAKDEEKKLLIGQIAARQKIRKKLPEWYHNFDLVFEPGLSLEQSSSEQTALLKASLIKGNQLLDITGGMGIDTYYLSQSFSQTTFVEINSELFNSSSHNLKTLSPSIETICGDGVEVLKKSGADVVYLDPYRRDDSNRKMVSLSDCTPDAIQLLPYLTKPGRTSIIKTSPMLDISAATSELQSVAEIWIISVKNDCKELVFVVKDGSHKILVKTFNITTEGTQVFQSYKNDKAVPSLSEPGKYLYEPNASILKGNGQDQLAEAFSLKKLHPQSNFFTSEILNTDFPGRCFEIKNILPPFDKSLVKGRYNVISRNFPQKADKIEKKLKLLSSKNDFLIATKTLNDRHIFITANLL